MSVSYFYKVYRSLPPGGKPIAVNKQHIINHIIPLPALCGVPQLRHSLIYGSFEDFCSTSEHKTSSDWIMVINKLGSTYKEIFVA